MTEIDPGGARRTLKRVREGARRAHRASPVVSNGRGNGRPVGEADVLCSFSVSRAQGRSSDAERLFMQKAVSRALSDEDRLLHAQLVEAEEPERAEWLRLEVALHARAAEDPAVVARFVELSRKLGLDAVNLLLRETILNCGRESVRKAPRRVRFEFACGKRWETLAPTETGSVRLCQQCEERVFYCDTIADAEARALAGQCIAVPKRLADRGEDREQPLQLGRPGRSMGWADRLFTFGAGSRDADLLFILYARDAALLGRCYALRPSAVTTVGRGVDNTIVLDGDGVSRRHARFERRGEVWWVVDGGSTNGTYVNDEQVREGPLRRGDRVRIGDIIFKLDDPPGGESSYSPTPIDGMTGLYNRRYLGEQIARELQDTSSAGRPLALALFDIDRFKLVNDVCGHLAGDQVLCEIAGLMLARVRQGDVLARWAGDRFALWLPGRDLEGAAAMVAEIRAEIAGHTFVVGERRIAVTLSAGVALAGEGDRGAEWLIRSAEEDLFAARRVDRGSPG